MNNTLVNIDEFVKKYNSFTSNDARNNYFKKTIIPSGYHDFTTVCYEADSIIATSCYDKNGDLHIDSCRKYINYIYAILKFYTNLDIQEDHYMEQFDALNQYGLIDKIIELVPDQYIKTLDSILQMKTTDLMTNEYDIHQYVNKQLAKLYPHIEKPLDTVLDILNEMIGKIDPSKIAKIMSKEE